MRDDKQPDSKLPALSEAEGLREAFTVKGAANSGANPGSPPATGLEEETGPATSGYPEVDEVVAWAARARLVAQEVVGRALAAGPLLTREAHQVASQSTRVLALVRLWARDGLLSLRRGGLEGRSAAQVQVQEHNAARVQAALGMRPPAAPMSHQDVVALLCSCKAVLIDSIHELDGAAVNRATVDGLTDVHNAIAHAWQVVESLGEGAERTLVRAVRAAAWAGAEDMREAAIQRVHANPHLDEATRQACVAAIRSAPGPC